MWTINTNTQDKSFTLYPVLIFIIFSNYFIKKKQFHFCEIKKIGPERLLKIDLFKIYPNT